MSNLVEISNLEFSYGPRKLLKGLSLKIPRGKVVAILGASGSGKSTLLRLIGGGTEGQAPGRFPDRQGYPVTGLI